MVQDRTPEPPELFVSYAHEDQAILRELEPHLALMRRQGVIRVWHDGKILPGDEWETEIQDRLASAEIIVLLVSADFMASDYIWGHELDTALERHARGTARVLPVIVRPCMWETAPFAKLQVLPAGAKPVTSWEHRDEAFTSIANGIARAAGELGAGPSSPTGRS